jgi:hypothetical protein
VSKAVRGKAGTPDATLGLRIGLAPICYGLVERPGLDLSTADRDRTCFPSAATFHGGA